MKIVLFRFLNFLTQIQFRLVIVFFVFPVFVFSQQLHNAELKTMDQSRTTSNRTTNSDIQPRRVDNGYFSYVITGDRKLTAENYRKALDVFKQTQPDKYLEWERKNHSEFVDGKYVISQEIFDKMPKSKQDYVLANPDKYIIRKD